MNNIKTTLKNYLKEDLWAQNENYHSKEIIEDIKNQLNNMKYEGDFSDIGNEIGIAIAKYIKPSNVELGYETEDIISGIKHGVSLIDGSHN